MVYQDYQDNLYGQFINYINSNFPYYGKTFDYLTTRMDDEYYEFAQAVCEVLDNKNRSLRKDNYGSLKSFIRFSNDYLQLQLELVKTGRYKYSTELELIEKVYSTQKMDDYYLDGLYLSQIFWVNHYKILRYFGRNFLRRIKDGCSILEVPGGTGIFTGIVLAKKKIKQADVIDISPSSIEYSKKIIELFSGRRDVKFYQRNIFHYNECQLYDYIICGELIEHVENPLKILEILKKAVRPGGYIFLTTACFTAAIDHIYLFNNMDEVRKLISASDLKCESEMILPLSLEAYNSKKNRDPLNVAMILKRL